MEHARGLSVQRMSDAYRVANAANLENLAHIKMQSLKTLGDENLRTASKDFITSMNKCKSGLYGKSKMGDSSSGIQRHKPISVWDQLQHHDTELYHKEMLDEQIRKKVTQMEMKAYLLNQMEQKKKDQNLEHNIDQAATTAIINQDIQRSNQRAEEREMWARQQAKNNTYLSKMNTLYKLKRGDYEGDRVGNGVICINEDSNSASSQSPLRKRGHSIEDFSNSLGVNQMLNGTVARQKLHQEKVNDNER